MREFSSLGIVVSAMGLEPGGFAEWAVTGKLRNRPEGAQAFRVFGVAAMSVRNGRYTQT